MPRGAGAKREREYKELKREFEKEGRYKGREEEVAARIVNKQRAQFGETKVEKRKDREGESPDRDLPIRDYQHKTTGEVERALSRISRSALKQVEQYEKEHKNRKGVLEAIDQRMNDGSSNGRHSSSGQSRRSRKRSSHRGRSHRSAKFGKSAKSHKSGGYDHAARNTTDHDLIRRWAEARGAKPSAVIRTESDGDVGIIRLDFPDYSGDRSLEEISWKDWFKKFEDAELVFVYQDRTAGGNRSNFNKLINR
ncbi:MAG TPA: hypothetical protein VJ719_04220 [Chthoniobacterales bacterium]|nr:hypothetical protein [Chthoniobacterales bacterium]